MDNLSWRILISNLVDFPRKRRVVYFTEFTFKGPFTLKCIKILEFLYVLYATWNWNRAFASEAPEMWFLASHKHHIFYTRYTVRGRGAKHFFPSGSVLEPTFYLVRSRTSLPELPDFRKYPDMKLRQIRDFKIYFSKGSQKVAYLMVQKGSLNRHIPVVNFINGGSLSGSVKIQGSNYR